MSFYRPFQTAIVQFVDAAGTPYAGGSLYAYAAGTSTPQNTYSTSSGTANTNPIVLDSAGRATIFLDQLAYKFILQDATGVQVWSQDNIGGSLSVDAAGSTWLGADGALSAYGVSFSADPNSGMRRTGDDAIALGTGGVDAFTINAEQALNSPSQPRCSVSKSTTQSIATATETAITFDTEQFDVGGMHEGISYPSRLTVPTGGAGLYLVIGQVEFPSNATGYRFVRLWKNGVSTIYLGSATSVAAGQSQWVSAVALFSLAAGDYIETYASQTSGSSLAIGTSSSFQAVKLW